LFDDSDALNLLLLSPSPLSFYQILQELQPKLVSLVSDAHRDSVTGYVDRFQVVVMQLRTLLYRCCCPQLIKFNQVRWMESWISIDRLMDDVMDGSMDGSILLR
jgi:hypothetical protein